MIAYNSKKIFFQLANELGFRLVLSRCPIWPSLNPLVIEEIIQNKKKDDFGEKIVGHSEFASELVGEKYDRR